MNTQQTVGQDELEPLALLNQYRAAEVHGAGAIMRLGRLADNLQLRNDLSRHLRDEAVHAWLWTKAIQDMGGEIHEVDEPYQTLLAQHFGIPRSLDEFLALTWVSERRGCAQYEEHLDVKDIPSVIRRTLRGILKDELWHVSYINEELQRRALSNPKLESVIDRALAADERTMTELHATDTFSSGMRPGSAS
ncbi:ferritin-like domain-containing protein [Streptomyces sp. NBC_01217]|uniref:ferritin-like domain-containing protein n=1 Tax=Streptomyces sp. NBC_01217 TaxID=2903779 RepID=UPI002E140BED|nr:ferritin-like domain-containing protein [Streptomyces sp. NBC_01217]